MDPSIIGLLGLLVLILVLLSGLPVGFAMALVGFAGICLLSSVDAALAILTRAYWETFSSYSLSVIPMFVLMGTIAFNSGISTRLYSTAHAFLGHLRGGLAITTIGGCALFAAVCGSSSASTAAMGKVAYPEMKAYKYNPSLATASIAAGGGLGVLIPPSTGFIVLAILMEQSVGKLFISGIFPGIILSILFMITIYTLCKINPELGPAGAKASWKARMSSLSGSIDMIILFALVMGGLFAGIFTPTEAGAAGAGGALILALARRRISWQGILSSLLETILISSMIFILVAGAFVFSPFMAYSRVTSGLIEWLAMSQLSPLLIIWLIVIGYLIGGCFMEFLSLSCITIPILYPVILSLGFDPIWFAVLSVLTAEMAFITPPVGMNVFVLRGVTIDVPLETIYRGVWPFVLADLACIALVIHFPQIATFLPNIMIG